MPDARKFRRRGYWRQLVADSQFNTYNAQPHGYALGDWLSTFSWTSFSTLTYRPKHIQVTPGSETSRTRATPTGRTSDPLRPVPGLLRHISKETQKQSRAFVAVETHQNGYYHLHALLQCDPDFDLTRAWSYWWGWYGRAQFERYRADLGASHYVSKYVLKECVDRGTWAILENEC